jgi:hypothetical protein
MRASQRKAVVLAQMLRSEPFVRPGDLVGMVCRFSVDRLALSGCAVLLITETDAVDTLATAGPQGGRIAELQFSLGEGPCLDAHRRGSPVLVPDLGSARDRWPAFAPAATELGVRAEFSLPLQLGASGLGTLDLSRDEPGLLDDDEFADALAAADIATDVLLNVQGSDGTAGLVRLLQAAGEDRLVVHQASGVLSVLLDVTTSDALARLRAHAFRTGRPINEIATDVVNRRVMFDE